MHDSAQIRHFISILLISILAIGMLLVMRPLPAAEADVYAITTKEPVPIAWPAYGQSAAGALGYGVLDSHGQQKPVPIASITKLVTALTVLHAKPLDSGEQGPILALNERDVAYFPDYLSRNGSVIPVMNGEQISQFKMLQAMLIPSANNMADSLAVWAFGSMDNYIAAANSYLKSIGLSNTKVADASGFSEKSVSTAEDLVKLGIVAMENPVLAEIVGAKQAEIPVAGTVYSTNRLLGQSGIVGIKTGNTEEAGGCYLYAARHNVAGQDIVIIGAVLSSPSLVQAMVDSRQILDSVKAGFTQTTIIKKGQPVAEYRTQWGGSAKVGSSQDIRLVKWKAHSPVVNTKLAKLKEPQSKGAPVGTIDILSSGQRISVEAILLDEVEPPSPAWRIFH